MTMLDRLNETAKAHPLAQVIWMSLRDFDAVRQSWPGKGFWPQLTEEDVLVNYIEEDPFLIPSGKVLILEPIGRLLVVNIVD